MLQQPFTDTDFETYDNMFLISRRDHLRNFRDAVLLHPMAFHDKCVNNPIFNENFVVSDVFEMMRYLSIDDKENPFY